MSTINLHIPMNPVGKGRPRFTLHGRAYTPKKTATAEAVVAGCYLAQRHGDPHEGPVEVTVTATMNVPDSWPKWKRAQALRGEWPCTDRRDIDNLAKLVTDGLNGVAYKDDRQITRLVAEKVYGENASLDVALTLLPVPERRAS